MFKKLLIANRGEVAARIARTAKHLEMQTVAIFSEPDAGGIHCEACDEAVLVGAGPLADSYLNVPRIIEIAKQVGADAIHPGYGPLSETAELAKAAAAAEIAFVGPSPELIERLHNRLEARKLAIDVGVRVPEGSDAPLTSVADALSQARELGFPLMVKPVRAGHRAAAERVDSEDEIEAAFQRVSSTAGAAYGDPSVYLERAFDRPRLVEVQVLADREVAIAVGERESSLQRGTLCIMDETPAPALSGSEKGFRTREAIWDAAVRIIQEAGYTTAAAVVFLIDSETDAYFLEVRSRLSVAHGITEMCTGCDLVEAQLRIVAGERMPEDILRAIPSGHAIEVRLLAEQPGRGIATGTVRDIRWPNLSPTRVRIESSVTSGSKITEHYEPELAKVITHAPTRHAALLMMDRLLAEHVIAPLPSNAALLRRILAHESFRSGQYDTELLDRLQKR